MSVRTLIVGGLIAALAVLIVVAGILGTGLSRAASTEHERGEAVRVARQLVENMTNLDYRRFDKDSTRVLTLASGDFRQQYASSRNDLRKITVGNKAISKGEVSSAGVVSFDPDSARILVAAKARVWNGGSDTPKSVRPRYRLDLAKEGGDWKIIDVRLLGERIE